MVTELIAADQKISLFEFFLRHHLVVHLDRHFGHGLPHPVKYTRLPEVDGAIAMTLSVLAKVGHVDEQEARQAFQAGVKTFPSQVQAPYVEGGFDFKLLASAITELSHASPKIKKLILTAAATTISYDHHVNVDEAEMFRAFSESLDCPVPPLLATPNPNRS
jgi:hypothetical protein